jgi:hypothetical protein
LKYKRCCLRREDDVALDALEAERVWGRMQSWALERFGDQLGAALKEHMDARGVGSEGRPANDEDLSLALCWLLIDRDVTVGGTPARVYSQLPELSAGERDTAARIARERYRWRKRPRRESERLARGRPVARPSLPSHEGRPDALSVGRRRVLRADRGE